MIRIASLIALALLAVVGCDAVRDVPTNSTGGPSSTAKAAATPAPAANQPAAAILFVKGFEAGARQAVQLRKPMLLFFTAEWCRYCHQMADEAFVNSDVRQLADRFVCVEIDADAEPEVCSQFAVQGYPTVLFVSPGGTRLNRLVGKKPSRQLLSAMQWALHNVARTSASNLQR